MPTPKSALRLALILALTTVYSRAADAQPAAATPAPEAAPAAEPAKTEPAADLAQQLAETQDKLATALRSYSLLQTENDQLKADAATREAAVQAAADKTVSETQAAAAKTTSDALAQAAALRDEVRQLQSQSAALAAENAQLRTRLALTGNPPGTTLVNPTRPGTAAAAVLQPAPATPAPEAAPAPRTHTIVPGDSLTKISKKYYGTPNRWEEIMKANPGVIKNSESIPLGAVITIP
ncbi:MAG: LysM peptidoglycan-binding domain-containing protein [Verrucomicrobia bacterium]|nr:LysM peptidoglycan-binding domain-containing protein [Verrucomicrobiota bacterium]